MKTRVLLTIFLIFGALNGQAQEDNKNAKKGPKIDFESAEHDFGDIDKGEKVTTKFKFKNTGDVALEIKNVTTSCGCTSATPEKTVYEPGESGEIPVTFNSERFAGKITKRVTITTNDTTSPKSVVTILGNVVTDLTSKPVSVFFPKAKMGQKATQEIVVSTAKLDELKITDLKAQPEYLHAELVKIDAKNAKVIVTADGTKFPQNKSRLNGSVTYNTNSKSQATVRTTVSIIIETPIRVSPNSVYLFASKAGQKREMRLSIKSTENSEFKLQDIKSDLDFIEVKLDSDEGKSKSLIITLKDSAPEGKFQGVVSMKTDVGTQPEVIIPIRGSVIPP